VSEAPDTLFVTGLRLHARHGVYDEERAEGRLFEVDVEATADLRDPGRSDALHQTVDYRHLAAAVVEVFGGPSQQLVEKLADDVCALLLGRHAPLRSVRVTVRKRATGVPGDPAWVGVTVRRERAAG
jgi:dihydroneopterin aldolase